ncbi:YebC/PmpR family DNA-binding transcriptional regulator [Neolewinella lacunae]|uniref:Probable transcriptional regulatory protein H9S92_17965 n=1 Tax=Neolewinella lacunae TaxID=1517758 RepID=A0A923PQS4_9BACT|nr:YebC/PmpR family DNA-binding transcriptional regulator [Neolewinella lacunae]MBC6996061.1 YebC/PmpR family DNA-binding transcriptional regulator [Neolewinella lacunae]MDN3636819.1 YebC/PmpR family DNA-binding transcriptional regulator [Neolewinella lacunae]
MGRAFEYRKAAKMKRWAGMAKAFTKVGREINIAIREGGADPDYNPRLRLAINNAKAVNMPKANVDAAIKRATDKDTSNYEEVTFEGYGPHGIAVFVEATTDNNNRTVANIRHAFSKYGGSLGVNGSVDYMFERKGQFIVKAEDLAGKDLESLEFELIDVGLDSMEADEEEVIFYTSFEDFAAFGPAMERLGIKVSKAELVRIPSHTKKLSDSEVEDFLKLIDKLEEDDDVANVFHTMDESE